MEVVPAKNPARSNRSASWRKQPMSITLTRRHFLASTGLATVAALTVGPAFAAKALTIATSLPSLSFPFFVHMQKQLAAEAKTLGDIKLIETDGQNQVPKQTADVEA